MEINWEANQRDKLRSINLVTQVHVTNIYFWQYSFCQQKHFLLHFLHLTELLILAMWIEI